MFSAIYLLFSCISAKQLANGSRVLVLYNIMFTLCMSLFNTLYALRTGTMCFNVSYHSWPKYAPVSGSSFQKSPCVFPKLIYPHFFIPELCHDNSSSTVNIYIVII